MLQSINLRQKLAQLMSNRSSKFYSRCRCGIISLISKNSLQIHHLQIRNKAPEN